MNEALLAAIASAQMGANSMLSEICICVIAVVEDHELDVAKNILNRVIVGAAFGQADPVQLQVVHDLTGVARLTWMSAVLIQGNPNCDLRIPMPDVMEKLTDIVGAFAGEEHPMDLSADSSIADEQVKKPVCFLVAW